MDYSFLGETIVYAKIAKISTSFIDVPDEIAVSIYFSGCGIRCKDCQNRELWEIDSGQTFSIDGVIERVTEHPIADYLVFLGGEPTCQVVFLQELCKKIERLKKVLYTGKEFEQLPELLLENLDMVICGPYDSNLHIGGWPASSNQRVIKKKGGIWNIQKRCQTTKKNLNPFTKAQEKKF
jgi:anaerobic ribonucleoside-triphosphate reductase activating protein